MADNLESLSDEELIAQYQQKIGKAPAPQDDLDSLSDDELIQLAQQKQTQPQQPARTGQEQTQPYSASQALSDLSTGARSLFSGATAGFSEPVFAGLNALQQAGFDPDKFIQAYDADIQRQKEQSSNFAGSINELVGALSPVSASQKIASGISKVAAPTAVEALGGVGLGQNILRSTGQAALAGTGEQALRSTSQQFANREFDPSKMISDISQAGTTSAAFGGGIPLTSQAIKQVAPVAKKALSVVGGVKPETINKYLANYDEISKAPTKEEAIQKVDDFVQTLKNESLSSKEKLTQAKDALKQAEQEAKYILQEKGFDLRGKINEAKQQLDLEFNKKLGPIKERANLQNLTDDIEQSIGELKQKVISGSKQSYDLLDNAAQEGVKIDRKSILDVIDNEAEKLKIGGSLVTQTDKAAYNKLKELKTGIKNVSSEAQKELDNGIKGQIQTMSQAIQNSNPGRRAFIMDADGYQKEVIGLDSTFPQWFRDAGFKSKEEFLSAVKRGTGKNFEKIKQLAEDRIYGGFDDGIHGRGAPDEELISKLDEIQYLEPAQAKQILQSLDREIEDAFQNNQFASAFDGAAAKTRKSIDEQLKNYVPGYKEAMSEVAKDAGLLSNANKYFKDKDAIRRQLGQVTKETSGEKAKVLEELGNATGYAFKDRIGSAKSAERTLGDTAQLEGIKSLLPANKKIQSLQKGLTEILSGRARDNFIERATRSESKAAQAAQESYDALKNDLSKVSQLASQNGSRKSIETFLASSKDNNIEVFKRLSELSSEDFIKTLQNIAVKEAFTKSAQTGSRNVNLFALIGSGALAGGVAGGGVGIPIGAAVGAVVDKFGPAMTKKILDGVVKVGKNPTVSKINNLNLPEEQKKYLVQQLNIAIRQQALKD